MEKKIYEKPEVTKVDFKFEDAIAASGCIEPDERQLFMQSSCRHM